MRTGVWRAALEPRQPGALPHGARRRARQVVKPRRHPLGVPYVDYVAPGMLAATAACRSRRSSRAYPIMAAIRWTRVTTRCSRRRSRVRDVVVGHSRTSLRGPRSCARRLPRRAWPRSAPMRSPEAIALAGRDHPRPRVRGAGLGDGRLAAAATRVFNALFRFGITPMFLFSGTFFPITRLPHGCRGSRTRRRSGTAST